MHTLPTWHMSHDWFAAAKPPGTAFTACAGLQEFMPGQSKCDKLGRPLKGGFRFRTGLRQREMDVKKPGHG
jgi:hypothetical protein